MAKTTNAARRYKEAPKASLAKLRLLILEEPRHRLIKIAPPNAKLLILPFIRGSVKLHWCYYTSTHHLHRRYLFGDNSGAGYAVAPKCHGGLIAAGKVIPLRVLRTSTLPQPLTRRGREANLSVRLH